MAFPRLNHPRPGPGCFLHTANLPPSLFPGGPNLFLDIPNLPLTQPKALPGHSKAPCSRPGLFLWGSSCLWTPQKSLLPGPSLSLDTLDFPPSLAPVILQRVTLFQGTPKLLHAWPPASSQGSSISSWTPQNCSCPNSASSPQISLTWTSLSPSASHPPHPPHSVPHTGVFWGARDRTHSVEGGTWVGTQKFTVFPK